MNDRLQALSDQGVSIWLDDLSRERLTTGSLRLFVQAADERRARWLLGERIRSA